ncbi:MAG: hypothetical protein ACK5EA_23320 [Planctomycetaceae bacterium]
MRWLLVCLWMIFAGQVHAAGPEMDLPNVGRCDFDALPDHADPHWNIDNLEYPAESIVVEDLGNGNRGIRVGRADGTESGRYTITLRGSTHDFDPSRSERKNSVTIRLAAQYEGIVMLAASIPGAGILVDLGRQKCTVRQRVGMEDLVVDQTDQVLAQVPGWRGADLHDYTLEWTPGPQPGQLPCRLLVDGIVVAEFQGHPRPAVFDPTLEISFENGRGTGLIDSVEWSLNGGEAKPGTTFVVRRGVRQLFLDRVGIESIEGLKATVHQPRRHPGNPVLRGELPWEATASVYGTLLYDREKHRFRLWYLCTPAPPSGGRKWLEVGGYRRVPHCTLLAYAESPDAIHWTKPVLNQVSFEGSKENNLIDIGIDNPEGVGIFHDPGDPDPQRRYKAFFWDRRLPPPEDDTGVPPALKQTPVDPVELSEAQRSGGMWVAFSPDGMKWQTVGPVLPQASDTTHTILFDPGRQVYLGYGRMGFGRTVALTESADSLHWSPPRRVLACDQNDGPQGQIYGMPVDRYEQLFLGMFWMYREGTDARIDTQLAVSRDGRRWRRVADRQTFLENGPEGAWDDGMSRAGRGINVVGDTIYLHYSMVNGPHRSAKFPQVERRFPGAVGLVTLRRDGFISLDAGKQLGFLVTRPFPWPGGQLHLNYSSPHAAVIAEIQNDAGNAITRGTAPAGDRLRERVGPLDGIAEIPVGTQVRLRLTLREAELYSWWLE